MIVRQRTATTKHKNGNEEKKKYWTNLFHFKLISPKHPRPKTSPLLGNLKEHTMIKKDMKRKYKTGTKEGEN